MIIRSQNFRSQNFRPGITIDWRQSRLRRAKTADVRTAPDDRFVVDVQDDPSVVASRWAQLEPAGTVFQTRAWLLPWYRVIAPHINASPLFVTVADRLTGRPLMFFPLCMRRKAGLAIIEFPDHGVSDYNIPIVAPDLSLGAGEMQALWQQICRALPPADAVLITKMPELLSGSPVPLVQLDWLQRMELRSWTVSLPGSREEYDKTTLKNKDRKELRRKRRHLADIAGEVALSVATSDGDRQEVFQALVRQRLARFKDCRRRDILADPMFLRFYEAVALENPGRIGALSTLRTRDACMATLFGLVHNGTYLLLIHSFELPLERLSPGIVAIDEMITSAIDSGLSHFDFTIGNEPYKRQFGVQPGFLYEGIYPLSVKGRLFAETKAAARRLKVYSHRTVTVWHTRFKAGLNRIFEERGRQGSP
nr:GNAT family N-acetyltransferase [uncultured Rhodopila sp.]